VTVGYGDLIPVTNFGRCITVIAMLLGVIVIAMPITVVGSTFNAAYSELRGGAAQKSSNSLAEAVLYMSSISHESACHAQGGCMGLMRPIRVKDRIGIRFPAPFGNQANSAKTPLKGMKAAQEVGQQLSIRHPLEHCQVGHRSHRHAVLAVEMCAAQV
jgi:hypothetical protein